MKTKSALRLLKATKQIALWSAALTGLAVSGLAQTTVAPAQTTAALPGYKIEETLLGAWDLFQFYPPIMRLAVTVTMLCISPMMEDRT
jgi:hypothetical protein